MLYEIILDGNKLNEYQCGRISGIIYVLTGMPEKTRPWSKKIAYTNWHVWVECSEEVFKTIVDTIEKVYPGAIVDHD